MLCNRVLTKLEGVVGLAWTSSCVGCNNNINLHTSSDLYGGNRRVKCGDRESRIMNKLLGAQLRPKQIQSRQSDPFFVNKPIMHSYRMSVKIEPKRAKVLNTMFKKHVSEVLSASHIAEGLIGKGVEITKVRMNLDLSAMRIFWINTGSTPSQEIMGLLEKVERPLRHELTHLHLLNFIPQITFTQDMEHEKMLEIQRLIDQAEKGEEEEDPIVEMEGTLSHDIKQKLKGHGDDESLPPFHNHPIRQDMGGIDRDDLINKILASKKFNIANREKESQAQSSFPDNLPVYRAEPTVSNRKLHIKQFLKDQKKKYKHMQNKFNMREDGEEDVDYVQEIHYDDYIDVDYDEDKSDVYYNDIYNRNNLP